jgi:hypothetical protein
MAQSPRNTTLPPRQTGGQSTADDALAPDNIGQSDAGQAQDVARDALTPSADLAEDSVHGGRGNRAALMPGDVPDLVDKMTEMLRSGHIDNGAYAGEPSFYDDDDDGGEDEDED